MDEKHDILIVLGAPNNADGRLSPIALSRAGRAVKEYHERPGCKVVPGGGYGEHFNTSDKPHAHYVAQYLVRNGVSPDDILEFADGSNTVEEAVLARRAIERHNVGRVCVITSDFHFERAKLIYEQVFAGYDVVVLGATARLSREEERRRRQHEAEALRRIEEQGGLIIPQMPR